jgi:serine protease Do
MGSKISLRTAGIIAGAAAVFAFLFGAILVTGIPALTNRSEAQTETHLPIPLVTDEGTSPFTHIAEAVSPSVVNIAAEKKVRRSVPGFEWYFEGPFEDFFRDFFRDAPQYEGRAQTLGSGFMISSDGYLITNYHVIKDASDIIVKMANKKEYKGEEVTVVGTDPRTDVALLKIESDDRFPALSFGNSDDVRVGDWAIAFGNPFQLEGTVTVGVISAKGRTDIALPEGPDYQSFLQTDAAINFGNSGGPLVNIRGEVIGINTAITSPSGGNVGIGFAIPANLAKSIIDELKETGKVTRGYLGVYLQDISDDLKDALDLPSLEGVLISEVAPNTPADRAGVQSGDVVLEYDGQKVKDRQSFKLQVAATPVGETVSMKVIRDGKEKKLRVTIEEYPAEQSRGEEREESELGLHVVSVTDAQAQRFKLEATQGVVVIHIDAESPAADAGIRVGDVILSIGKTEIDDISDYQTAIAELAEGKAVIFHIQRGERKLYIAVTP